MKKIFTTLILIFISQVVVANSGQVVNTQSDQNQRNSCQPKSIVGQWKYWGYTYDGVTQQRPDQNLNMYFIFGANGEDALFWHRTNTEGYCFRRGAYSFNQCELTDEVTSVHPDNRQDCSSDPDMRPKRKVNVKVEVKGNRMYLFAQLSGKDFIYIWDRIGFY